MLNELMTKFKSHTNQSCQCQQIQEITQCSGVPEDEYLANIPNGTITLNDLNPGDKATIVSLLGCSRFHSRLQEMGFVAGKQIQVIRFAPIGDPMEIDILGTKLSLRKAEAAYILVARINP